MITEAAMCLGMVLGRHIGAALIKFDFQENIDRQA